jgi:plasmid maintenance system antidote protein VapI
MAANFFLEQYQMVKLRIFIWIIMTIKNEVYNGRRAITVDSALLLAKAFENTPDFWLNMQRRNDIWAALNTPKRKARIDRARPVRQAFA